MSAHYKTLTEPQALVLFTVWQAKQVSRPSSTNQEQVAGRKDGLTNLEIQEAVMARYDKNGKLSGASLGNIKKIIAALEVWQPKPLLVVAAREANKFNVYRLSKEMVRWSTTATMLLRLETANEISGPTTRTKFVSQIEQCKLTNPDGTVFSREDIDEAIHFCSTLEHPYILERTTGFISVTDRVNDERKFFELIKQD